MSQISRYVSSVTNQIEQATTKEEVNLLLSSAQEQLQDQLSSLSKSVQAIKPMADAGLNISQPSADLSKLAQTCTDIINFIQQMVSVYVATITTLQAEITEIPIALTTLATVAANKIKELDE